MLAVGNRLSIRQVGFNHETWAREAYVIVNDIDSEELKKPTIHVDMPIWADAKDLLTKLDARLPEGKLFQNQSGLQYAKIGRKTIQYCSQNT